MLIAGSTGFALFARNSLPSGGASKSSTSQTTIKNGSQTGSSQAAQRADSLELLNGSVLPPISSSLTTPETKTPLINDTLPVSYEGWSVTGDLGDLQPDIDWFQANSSGLTLNDQTCSALALGGVSCGPYQKANLQHTSNFTEVEAGMNNLPANLTAFSIDVDIPYYPFFQSCVFNSSQSGCSYEGSTPMLAANWALNAYGPITSYSIALNVAEIRNGTANALSIGASYDQTLCSVVGCDNDGPRQLNSSFLEGFSSFHRLAIVTDRSTYIEMFVDGRLIYSNHNAESFFSSAKSGFGVAFYQYTSVNNETTSTTWSNFSAYPGPDIIVAGLSAQMDVRVTGAEGFNAVADPNQSGVAVVNVISSPSNLTLAVEENGRTITTFQGQLAAGCYLEFFAH